MPAKFDHPLPLPNPGDWLTSTGAAELLGVHRLTINRMVRQGVLHSYVPVGPAATSMFWRAEVAELAAARDIVKPRTAAG